MSEIILECGRVAHTELATAISLLSSSHGQQMPRRLSETSEEASSLLAPQLHCRSAWGQFDCVSQPGEQTQVWSCNTFQGQSNNVMEGFQNRKWELWLGLLVPATYDDSWLAAGSSLCPRLIPLSKWQAYVFAEVEFQKLVCSSKWLHSTYRSAVVVRISPFQFPLQNRNS